MLKIDSVDGKDNLLSIFYNLSSNGVNFHMKETFQIVTKYLNDPLEQIR